MQCKELAAVLEQDPDGQLTATAQEHLIGCVACQELLADLSSIVAVAKELPAEVEPPARVWVSLRAQMAAEGLLREAERVGTVSPTTSRWGSLSALLQPRGLAAAGVGIALVFGALSLMRKPGTEPSSTKVTTVQPAGPAPSKELQPTPSRLEDTPLLPSPSEMAATFRQVERDVPSNMQLAGDAAVQASLRENLRTVNEFIAECEQHLKQNPQDELAREYLYSAYQQKANLLAAMMESGRSEH